MISVICMDNGGFCEYSNELINEFFLWENSPVISEREWGKYASWFF